MSRTEDDLPIPPDETEPLEEGDIKSSGDDAPVKGDATQVLPLSAERNGGDVSRSDGRHPPSSKKLR
jgi:hypothetical protein